MTDAMRSAVRRVAATCPCAIISGRGRDKVFDFVRIDELYYAGSHGLDICGPRISTTGAGASAGPAGVGANGGRCAAQASSAGGSGAGGQSRQDAPDSRPNGANSVAANGCIDLQPAEGYVELLDAVCAELKRRLSGIGGAEVEHNKYCLSVHYRRVEESDWPRVWKTVEEVRARARMRGCASARATQHSLTRVRLFQCVRWRARTRARACPHRSPPRTRSASV